MPIVPEATRVQAMRRVGLSDSMIKFSTGRLIHEAFDDRCQTPHKVYHGCRVPKGPRVIPLWECFDTVTAVRIKKDVLEFFRFGVEWIDVPEILSQSKKGWLAHQIIDLYEDNDEYMPSDLDDLARIIGFRYLPRLVKSYSKSDHSTSASCSEFRLSLILSIDTEERM